MAEKPKKWPDARFEATLLAVKYYRSVAKMLEKMATALVPDIAKQFTARHTDEYDGKTVRATYKGVPSAGYDPLKLIETYGADQLVFWGALSVGKEALLKNSGLKEDELERYQLAGKDAGSRRLDVYPKPSIDKTVQKEVARIAKSYPTTAD